MVYAGVVCFLGSMGLIVLYIYAKTLGNDAFWGLSVSPGWVSIVCLLLLLLGLMMLGFAIIGQYVIRVFDEVKGRPPYIIEQKRIDR